MKADEEKFVHDFLEKIKDIEETALLKLFHSVLEDIEKAKKEKGEVLTERERRLWERDFEQFMRILSIVRKASGRKFSLPKICKGLPNNKWARVLQGALISASLPRSFDLETAARLIVQHKIIKQ